MSLSQTVTWIPLEERMPTLNKNVFYATSDGCRCVGYFNGTEWRCHPHSTVDTPAFIVTHWAEPLKGPSELQAEIDARAAERAAGIAKYGRRCIECGAPISECECN